MSLRLIVAALAIFAGGFFASAEAQDGRDERLVVITTQDVDLKAGKATIDLSNSRGAYRGIRIRSKSGTFDIASLRIRYSDGKVHEEDRRIDMRRGERSRPIDYSGTDRFIDVIELTQRPGRGMGRLEIIGIQTAEGAKLKRGAARAGETTELYAKPTGDAPTAGPAGTVTDGGEVLFGAQYVGFGVDRDIIRVGSEIGKFGRLRMRVLDNDIFISELKVVYVDGSDETLAVNANVAKNTKTGWLSIKPDRFMREIQMVYRSRPSVKGQARVEVFGDYADNWLGPGGEGRKYNQGWVLLGAQSAGFIGFDKDIMPVGRNEGGFKRVRVSVKDRAITLNELRVVYESGGEDVIPVRTRVDAGGTFGPVDIKGGTRVIKEIQAKYRSRFFDSGSKGRGMAIVEIWGQH